MTWSLGRHVRQNILGLVHFYPFDSKGILPELDNIFSKVPARMKKTGILAQLVRLDMKELMPYNGVINKHKGTHVNLLQC